MKIKLSKSQWEKIGKKAGWIKEALRDLRNVIVNFDTLEFIESRRDIDLDSNNTWKISYNHSTLNDQQLLTSLLKLYGNGLRFYIELFKAADFSAFNIRSGQKITAEELAKMVFPDAEDFWGILRQSDEVYNAEREIEQRDMEMQQDMDEHEPDTLRPQY
jgi:hypothetical protein